MEDGLDDYLKQLADELQGETGERVVGKQTLFRIVSQLRDFRAAWQPIGTAPEGEQIIVWEPNYGWLLACKNRHMTTGWAIKSSGNFYAEMPRSVVDALLWWVPLPAPPA